MKFESLEINRRRQGENTAPVFSPGGSEKHYWTTHRGKKFFTLGRKFPINYSRIRAEGGPKKDICDRCRGDQSDQSIIEGSDILKDRPYPPCCWLESLFWHFLRYTVR